MYTLVLTCHVYALVLQLGIDLIVVTSFVKPGKKGKKAVPDSEQSDHHAT